MHVLLLFFRDDNGDFIAARGYRGCCSLANQLIAIKGPPAVTPANDGITSPAPFWYAKPALNKFPHGSELLMCVASVKVPSSAA